MFCRISTLSKQMSKSTSSLYRFLIIHRRTNNNTRWMQIIVQCFTFTEEFRRENNTIVIQFGTQTFRIANWNRGLNNDPSSRAIFTNSSNSSLDTRSIEIILLRVIVSRRCHYSKVGTSICLSWINSSLEIKIHGPIALTV